MDIAFVLNLSFAQSAFCPLTPSMSSFNYFFCAYTLCMCLHQQCDYSSAWCERDTIKQSTVSKNWNEWMCRYTYTIPTYLCVCTVVFANRKSHKFWKIVHMIAFSNSRKPASKRMQCKRVLKLSIHFIGLNVAPFGLHRKVNFSPHSPVPPTHRVNASILNFRAILPNDIWFIDSGSRFGKQRSIYSDVKRDGNN